MGWITAMGLPRSVTTTSSPCLVRRRYAVRRFFSSLIPTVLMSAFQGGHCSHLPDAGQAWTVSAFHWFSPPERVAKGIHCFSSQRAKPRTMGRGERKREDEPVALLVQVLHGGGAEDDEEADPQGRPLVGDRLVDLFLVFLVGFVARVGLKDNRVEEEGQETENEKELDEEDRQILCMVIDGLAGLRQQQLIDVVQVDAAGEQQDDQQCARDLLVLLIERVGDRLDVFLGDGLLQARRHGHDQKGQPADPDDGGEKMKPMVDDGDELIDVGEETLECVHSDLTGELGMWNEECGMVLKSSLITIPHF